MDDSGYVAANRTAVFLGVARGALIGMWLSRSCGSYKPHKAVEGEPMGRKLIEGQVSAAEDKGQQHILRRRTVEGGTHTRHTRAVPAYPAVNRLGPFESPRAG
eukprot:3232244-Prymnesium_polylepis.1